MFGNEEARRHTRPPLKPKQELQCNVRKNVMNVTGTFSHYNLATRLTPSREALLTSGFTSVSNEVQYIIIYYCRKRQPNHTCST